MIGDAPLLLLVHDALLLFESRGDPFHALGEFLGTHCVEIIAGCQERRLIHQIRQVGPAEPWSDSGDFLEIDRVIQLHVLHVHLENRLATQNVRPIDQHVTIEPARSQQGRIQCFRSVRGRNDDGPAVGAEAVHLDQQRIECLFALVVTAHDAGPARLA